MKVGEMISPHQKITLHEGRGTRLIRVANTGDRPIQVGSHYHFFEVNERLSFEREKSIDFRLDIPSGTSVRFEPGEEKEVQLVKLGGKQEVYGLRNLTCGRVESKGDESL